MGKSHAAFTLIELVAVAAIAAVVLTFAYFGYQKAARSARGAKALSELRVLGVEALTYAADNNGLLPQSSHQGPRYAWTRVLKRSLPPDAFRSSVDSTDRVCSYAINDFVTQHPFGEESLDFSRIQSIPAPSQTMYLSVSAPQSINSDHFHFASDGWAPDSFEKEVWVAVVDDSGLYLFVDGHVELLKWTLVESLLNQPDTRFVRPDGGTLIHESIQ